MARREITMNLRMHESMMRRLDRWRGRQDVPPTRPEAIRQILERTFSADDASTKRTSIRRTA
jgi:hypothetical protein